MAGGEGTTLIQGSRTKTVLATLAGVLFVVLGGWIVLHPEMAHGKAWIGWPCVILFGALTLIGAYRVIFPARLTLMPEGFVLDTPPFPKRTRLWVDIDQIYIWQVRSTKIVAFTYLPGRQPNDALTTVNAGLGAPGTMGGHWQIGPEELLALASHYHRLATSGAPRD